MAIRRIVKMGNPVLARPASPVEAFATPELLDLVEDLKDTMIASGGVGLAAPQIAASWQVLVYFVPAERNGGESVPVTTLINPELKRLSDDVSEDWEACLSVPGLAGRVGRWSDIGVRYRDVQGGVHEMALSGYHARVVQHECDHLHGVLYPMRMRDLSSLGYVDELSRGDEGAASMTDDAGTNGAGTKGTAADEVGSDAGGQPDGASDDRQARVTVSVEG